MEVEIEYLSDKLIEDKNINENIKKAVNAATQYLNFKNEGLVSVTLCADNEIQELNLKYRSKDMPTDVLSFPMYEFDKNGKIINEAFIEDQPILIGDIVISLERAKKQAIEYGHSVEREIAFLTVHSMLHLFGYDHELDEDRRRTMREAEEEILKAIGLSR